MHHHQSVAVHHLYQEEPPQSGDTLSESNLPTSLPELWWYFVRCVLSELQTQEEEFIIIVIIIMYECAHTRIRPAYIPDRHALTIACCEDYIYTVHYSLGQPLHFKSGKSGDASEAVITADIIYRTHIEMEYW